MFCYNCDHLRFTLSKAKKCIRYHREFNITVIIIFLSLTLTYIQMLKKQKQNKKKKNEKNAKLLKKLNYQPIVRKGVKKCIKFDNL